MSKVLEALGPALPILICVILDQCEMIPPCSQGVINNTYLAPQVIGYILMGVERTAHNMHLIDGL